MRVRQILIVTIAVVFTAFAFFNTISTHTLAVRSSEDKLDSSAFLIGLTVEQMLNRSGIDEDLFVDLIKRQPWEEIAFISLYDSGGNIILHSSKRLIGERTKDPGMDETLTSGQPSSSSLHLKTGETVYIMDIPIRIHTLSPSLHLLRTALHPYPSQGALRHARIHTVTAFIIVAFLWILVLAYLRYAHRVDELRRREIESKHFTMLGEMSAVLAHEIRSPLSAIKGFAQYIQEKIEKDSSADEGLEVIITESQRLERLTEDLLIYARTGEVHPEKFPLSTLLEEVKNLFISEQESIAITWNLHISDDMLYTDKEKLRHIFINIVQNSIDSIEGEGHIEIDVFEKKDVLSISSADSGKGMDEETLRNSRTPFFTTKTRGTGLGLALVGNLLKSLKGSLEITSKPGHGTTVTISFKRYSHEQGKLPDIDR